MTTATHRAWCNSHIDDEPIDTFGLDVVEEDHGLAVEIWHPMRPGQERRPFTAAEARAIAAELVRAAELVEAEGGEPKA